MRVRLSNGELTGDDTRARSRGGFGGRRPRQVGLGSQRRRSGNRRQAELVHGDGPGHCRSRPTQRKMAHEAFSFLELLSHLNFHLE
jgi:hypothetical protein